MFDCSVTVKGNGVGRYGRFKNDKTGPLSQFMVDNVYLYKVVKNHILNCDKCSPTAALQHYYQRRLNRQDGSSITTTLAKLALGYERTFRKNRPIPKELVDDFIRGTYDSLFIQKYEHRFKFNELVEIAANSQRFPAYLNPILRMQDSQFKDLCVLARHGFHPSNENEIGDIMKIVGVMEV